MNKFFLLIFFILATNVSAEALEHGTFSCENNGMGSGLVKVEGLYTIQYDSRLAQIDFLAVSGSSANRFTYHGSGEARVMTIAHLEYSDPNAPIKLRVKDFNYKPSHDSNLSELILGNRHYELRCTVKIEGEAKPECRGMRYSCRDELTGKWSCCSMGAH